MDPTHGYPEPIRPGLTKIAWIGTGIMGAAMAARLLAAGYSVTIYARTPSKAVPLVHSGAHLAASPAAASIAADVLFTMVSHPADVRSTLLDPLTGALSTLPPRSVLVDMTTSSPSLAREVASIAQATNRFSIDAPVSGGDIGARDGKLAIFAGGDEDVVRWLSPLFEIMGTATWMGEAGSGQSSKIANQIAAGGSLLGLSEAMLFAKAEGLDERRWLEAVKKGSARSWAMELFGEKMIERDFAPGGFAEYMVKDLGMGMEWREEEVGVVLPGAALCKQLFVGMVAQGKGKMGIHGLITAIERMNGKEA